MTSIRVEKLSFQYGAEQIIHNLSVTIPSSSFFGIAGPNGTGKSTLLNLLCRILTPRSGSIYLSDREITSFSLSELAKTIAVVRQEFVPVFAFSVYETVLMARNPYVKGLGFEKAHDRDAAMEALELTDTARFASRSLGQLSGGERQRVFIARALAQKTPVLLLDEPTNFLDLKHQVDTYDLLKKMQLEQKKTIVLISHDLNLATQYCNQILLMGTNKTYFVGEPDAVMHPDIISAYFNVQGYCGKVHSQRLFIPLGSLAKDNLRIDQ